MAFVCEERDYHEVMPEWEYLNRVGVRTWDGKPIEKKRMSLVLDRENNYYLIPSGGFTLHLQERTEVFYSLVMHDKVVWIVTKSESSGARTDGTYAKHWYVLNVEFPEGWDRTLHTDGEMREVIRDGLYMETFFGRLKPGMEKEITVEFQTEIDQTRGRTRYGI